METVQRPSLGQIAALGDLYDGHNDSFLPLSLIQGPLPETTMAVKVTEKDTSTFTHSLNDSYKEKFLRLGVSKGLQASFLGGLVESGGAAHYMAENRDSALVTGGSLYHKAVTVSEKLELAAPGLREYLDFSVLQDTSATHIVTEISWGASTVVSAKYTPETNDTHPEASTQALQTELLALKAAVEGSTRYSHSGRSSAHDSGSFQVKVFSDVKGNTDSSPSTFEEAYEFLSKIPTYTKQCNRGKGKPVTYTLVPLTFLGLIFSDETLPEISLTALGNETLANCVALFDEFRGAQRALSDYRLRVKAHRHCVPEEYIHNIQDLKVQLNAREATLKSEFGSTVEGIRTGDLVPKSLQKLLVKFQTGPLSPNTVRETINQYSAKMDFSDLLIAKGATYIGFGTQGPKVGAETYTFRFNWSDQNKQPSFEENKQILLELLKAPQSNTKASILVRDCDAIKDANGNHEIVAKPTISHEHGTTVITPDVAEDRKELLGKGFMEYKAASFEVMEEKDQKRPTKLAKVKIPCPGPGCPTTELPEWICSKCRSTVLFGFDDLYLYCDCGRGKYNTWGFRCTNTAHKNGPVQYDAAEVLKLLLNLPPIDTLNILILGVTGVGKSTFINAFVNYLSYDSLDDAMKTKPLTWLIPFAFSTQAPNPKDPKGKLIETMIEAESSSVKKTTSPQNEKLGVTGQSSTQKTMVHSVQMGNTIVRLFDTPGIGDTRGLDVDKSNMADILATLANYEELHGIIILLKPNNARLDAMFTFCLGELLTHLHRDATKNLVFGFTNTRGSNYQPGDTFGPLTACLRNFNESQGSSLELVNDNVYCFDSESFRYLAAYHRGVEFKNHDDYVKSWETSTREAQRLLEYFKSRPPHTIKQTINLNDTRHMLTTLTGPMAEIVKKIAETIVSIANEIKHLDSDKVTELDLQGRLITEIHTLRCVQVDRPRTVCCHENCIEHRSDRGVMRIVYKTKCHDPCSLDDVPADKRAPPGLIYCGAFKDGTCIDDNCRHSWQDHMHILYELIPDVARVENPETQRLLAQATNIREQRAIVIADKQNTVKQLELEHSIIEKAAVQFCIFLKRNSITPYNDGTLEYLEHLIKIEKGSVAAQSDNPLLRNQSTLDSLQDYKAKYERLKAVMSKKADLGDTSELLTSEEIHAKVAELYKLPSYGETLRQLTETVSKAHQATHREYNHKVKVKAKQWTLMGAFKDLLGLKGQQQKTS